MLANRTSAASPSPHAPPCHHTHRKSEVACSTCHREFEFDVKRRLLIPGIAKTERPVRVEHQQRPEDDAASARLPDAPSEGTVAKGNGAANLFPVLPVPYRRRRRWTSMAAALVAFILAAGAGAYWWQQKPGQIASRHRPGQWPHRGRRN